MSTDKVAKLEPLVVTVLGTGDGSKPLKTGTVAQTASSDQPNLVVTVIQPLTAIGVRFIHAYLTILVALISAGMTTNIIPAADFAALVISCAQLSLAGAGLGALKDIATIFSRLGGKYPLLTGEV